MLRIIFTLLLASLAISHAYHFHMDSVGTVEVGPYQLRCTSTTSFSTAYPCNQYCIISKLPAMANATSVYASTLHTQLDSCIDKMAQVEVCQRAYLTTNCMINAVYGQLVEAGGAVEECARKHNIPMNDMSLELRYLTRAIEFNEPPRHPCFASCVLRAWGYVQPDGGVAVGWMAGFTERFGVNVEETRAHCKATAQEAVNDVDKCVGDFTRARCTYVTGVEQVIGRAMRMGIMSILSSLFD